MRDKIKILFFIVLMPIFYAYTMEKLPEKSKSKSNTKAKLLYLLKKINAQYASFFEYQLLNEGKEAANKVLFNVQDDVACFNILWSTLLRRIREEDQRYINYLLQWILKVKKDFFYYWYEVTLNEAITKRHLPIFNDIFLWGKQHNKSSVVGTPADIHARQLFHAVNGNAEQMVTIFLDDKTNPHVEVDERSRWTLLLALENRSLAMVSLLLKYPININKINKNNYSPLSFVIGNTIIKEEANDYELVNVLLQAGADPNLKARCDYTEQKRSLLQYIAKKNVRSRFLKLFLNYGAVVGACNAWYQSLGQPKKQQLLLDAGIGPNMICPNKKTIFCTLLQGLNREIPTLMFSEEKEKRSMIASLIETMFFYGADIYAGDKSNEMKKYLFKIGKSLNKNFSIEELEKDKHAYFNREISQIWQQEANRIRSAAALNKTIYPIDWHKEKNLFVNRFIYVYLFKTFAQNIPLPKDKNYLAITSLDHSPIISLRGPALLTLLNN